jgi:hypothetical protein
MSKEDRQKLSILVVLLGVLALTLVLAYRMNQPTTAVAVQPPETKTANTSVSSTGAQLLLPLVEKSDSNDGGKKNIFEFGHPPAPPAPPRGSSPFARGGQPPNTGLPPASFQPTGPRPPPPPPPIPLKYQGYLVLETPTGGFTAVVGDDARHYNVTVGEVLMGRYRILAITDKVVDVEDMEYNRRQSLPIVK